MSRSARAVPSDNNDAAASPTIGRTVKLAARKRTSGEARKKGKGREGSQVEYCVPGKYYFHVLCSVINSVGNQRKNGVYLILDHFLFFVDAIMET